MVFKITEDGLITADTLCNFVEFPRGATYLVGDKYQVRALIKFWWSIFMGKCIYCTLFFAVEVFCKG